MIVKSLLDVQREKVSMDGAEKAFKQIPISKEDGTPNYSMRVFTLKSGGYTPYHQHDYEHVNYIISGNGELVDETGNKKTLKEGDFALVMPNEKHQYRNTSDSEDFVMICGVPKSFE
ncbi:MAG: hypothetical protein SCALA702_23730 [Melioribacteraceae bacterium]|nr:MAG: hypothetical protein SCALA702_23730 [Melioribacteraceae bacterium]